MTSQEPEPTVSSEKVFSGSLITVRKEMVRTSRGKMAERDIVEHGDTIAVLPVLDDGRVLFVRQFRKPVGEDLLEVPAGGVDRGETPEEAAHREMEEETGYRVGTLEKLCSFYLSPGYTTEYMHLFRATNLTVGERTGDDPIRTEPISPDEARGYLRAGHICDAKTIIAMGYMPGGLGA